jgi:hypothetical protein
MIRYAFSETATTTRFLDKNHELGLSQPVVSGWDLIPAARHGSANNLKKFVGELSAFGDQLPAGLSKINF